MRMHDISFLERHTAWLIFLITGLAAVAYILLGTHSLVAGDARAYLDAALGLIGANGYTLNDVSRNTLLRAPWYILTLSAFAFPLQGLGEPAIIFAIRLFQALLLAFNMLLIFQIGRLTGLKEKEALLAVGLALFYAPFYRISSCLLVETQVITFLLLAVYFWLKERPALSGFLLFLGLSNSGLSLWPKLLILMPMSVLAIRQKPALRQKILMPLKIMLGGTLLMNVAAWLLPHQSLSANGFWYYADTGGWIPLVPASGMQSLIAENGLAVLPRYFHAQGEGFVRLTHWLLLHSQQALLLFGNNYFQIFARPDNVYRQAFLFLGPQGQIVYHQFLIIAALLAGPLLFSNRRLWICWFWLPVWMVYALDHTETRYNLPWMPFAILLATFFLSRLDCSERKNKGALLTLALLLGLVQAQGLYPWLAAVFPALSLELFIETVLGATLLIFGVYIYKTGARRFQQFWPLLLCGLPALCHFLLVPPDSHWTMSLTASGPAIEKVLRPAPIFWKPAELSTFLLIDTQPPVSSTVNDLAITVNGFSVDSRSTAPAVLNELTYMRGGLIAPDAIRQYRILALAPVVIRSIETSGHAVVRVGLNSTASAPAMLYGDYALNHQSRFAVPDPDWGDYSLYKSYFDGDGRPPIEINSRSSQSRLLSKPPDRPDLSTAPGLQTGQYRIFLLRMPPADAANPVMPAPSFQWDPIKGQLAKTLMLAY